MAERARKAKGLQKAEVPEFAASQKGAEAAEREKTGNSVDRREKGYGQEVLAEDMNRSWLDNPTVPFCISKSRLFSAVQRFIAYEMAPRLATRLSDSWTRASSEIPLVVILVPVN